MSNIFEDEITLPGVITHVEADYSTGYDTSLFGTTDSEIIIGTAFNGPVGTLTPVYSVDHAIYTFGDAYDSSKRQEASLIPGVKDAWDRGCRTIYCMRIGGQEMYKDFNLKLNSEYKLRLKSMFPTNIGKECYVLISGAGSDMTLSYYKPIDRATISEKKRGVATGNKTVIKNTINLYDQGLSKNDRLADLINLFNEQSFNNVLTMAIVDADGNDVTNTPEAYDISIGAIYSGVYFIGRNNTVEAVPAVTKTEFVYINSDDDKPYSSFDGTYYQRLVKNTDVSVAYPIYGTKKELVSDFQKGSVLMVDEWDFLEVAESSDKLFTPDDVDYEETSLSNFEIYQRLGSGYAVTAHAIRRTKKTMVSGKEVEVELTPRIKESDNEDSNHITPIDDGIYATLQNSNARYRVLTCVNADDSIDGKLPRAEDFRAAVSQDATVLNGDLTLTSVVDSSDLKAARKYQVSFEKLPEKLAAIDMTDVDTANIREVIAEADADAVASDFEVGTLLVQNNKVVRVNASGIVSLANATVEGMKFVVVAKDGTASFKEIDADGNVVDSTVDKTYALANCMDSVFVYRVADVKNLGDLTTLGSDSNDKLTVAATNLGGVVNKVTIRSNMFDTTTVDELRTDLNAHSVFGALFQLALTEQGTQEKDDFIENTTGEAANETKAFAAIGFEGEIGDDSDKKDAEVVELEDRVITYDYTKYIPYRTTDNFLRQLAQHCTYTELKTGPTHGVMGCSTLTNLGLSSVASKVTKTLAKDFDLYAKTNVGHNMLDANSLPYPIGKNVSLVLGQYTITVGNSNYRAISNGAAGYAAMVSCLDLEQSSTGQPIDLPDLAYTLTNTQLGNLTSAGIVTFKESYTRGTVVTDGVTMAPAESIFRRLSTSRIVGAVEELIRAAAEPYIGKENHQANRNALNTAIKSELDKIVDTLIEDYNFTMSTDSATAKLGYIEIYYEVIPIYEIREVRNTIKMVDTLSTSASE